ncbi:hypothetical protein Hanom_Chr16g01421751 [Helianthus anomalus]
MLPFRDGNYLWVVKESWVPKINMSKRSRGTRFAGSRVLIWIRTLARLMLELEGVIDIKQYMEAKNEHIHIKDVL